MKRRRVSSRVYTIVPVKALTASKARLSPLLSPPQRRQLTLAMLRDVLRALNRVRGIHRITVVSGDRSIRNLAVQMGASFLWEGCRMGLNKALTLAIRDAIQRNAPAVLIVPSDVPFISPSDIRWFLKMSDGYSVAITPSKDGLGTNCLLLRQPNIIDPVFGKNSFRKHLAAANRKGVPIRVLRREALAYDIDEPKDLITIKRVELENETGRFLRTVA